MDTVKSMPLVNKGLIAVIVAQFFSIFGENAILFTVVALLKSLHYPDWSKPGLQICFVAAYLLTSVFNGQIADSFPKGRVLFAANGLKVVGAVLIFIGLNPFLGYAIIGLGAAIYSPAKYGILSELNSKQDLVKANSLLEVVTIVAILLGSVSSGYLADLDIRASIGLCCIMFFLGTLANLAIPKLKLTNPNPNWHITTIFKRFYRTFRIIWHSPVARFSLLGTCIFWGASIVLRFLLIDWVPYALGVTDNALPTVLNSVVAIGLVIGAALASKLINTSTIKRSIPAGIVMGIVVAFFMLQKNIYLTYVILLLIGALGSLFFIPLNAYIQNFGQDHTGSGNAVAVQDFGENITMLIMLGLYIGSDAIGFLLFWVGILFGVFFSAIILYLAIHEFSKKNVKI